MLYISFFLLGLSAFVYKISFHSVTFVCLLEFAITTLHIITFDFQLLANSFERSAYEVMFESFLHDHWYHPFWL